MKKLIGAIVASYIAFFLLMLFLFYYPPLPPLGTARTFVLLWLFTVVTGVFVIFLVLVILGFILKKLKRPRAARVLFIVASAIFIALALIAVFVSVDPLRIWGLSPLLPRLLR